MARTSDTSQRGGALCRIHRAGRRVWSAERARSRRSPIVLRGPDSAIPRSSLLPVLLIAVALLLSSVCGRFACQVRVREPGGAADDGARGRV